MYFSELNSYVFKAYNELLKNDAVCKLLYNTGDMNKKITEEVREIIGKENIYPFNYIPTETEKKCIISIILDDGGVEDNGNIRFGKINFLIWCHQDIYKTDTGLRPFSLMNEIDKIFNSKGKSFNDSNYNPIGAFGGLILNNYNHLWNSKSYSGYIMQYTHHSIC